MLKIGQLIFTKKALQAIALVLFFQGAVIGFLVAYVQDSGNAPHTFLIFLGMFVPYFLLRKRINQNIIDLSNEPKKSGDHL